MATTDGSEPGRVVIPPGTRITCEAGHAITTTAEALHHRQKVQPSAFGPFAPFQGLRGPPKDLARGIPGQRCGPCFCGRAWSRLGQLHTDGGWLPPRSGPTVQARAESRQRPA